MRNVEKAPSTTIQPETTFEAMLNANRDRLSDLACSEDLEDGENENDDEEDTELGTLSEDDEPARVMGTISGMVQPGMDSFWQKQMRLDELSNVEWKNAANYFRERDMKYGRTELKVPAVVKPQTDRAAAAPSPTTFEEHMHLLAIVP